MDQLLMSSQVILRMSDNSNGNMRFHFTLRINKHIYGLHGLPIIELNLCIQEDDGDGLEWYNTSNDDFEQKAMDRLFRTATDADIAYYLTRIYNRLVEVANFRGLLSKRGCIYQLPAGIR